MLTLSVPIDVSVKKVSGKKVPTRKYALTSMNAMKCLECVSKDASITGDLIDVDVKLDSG